MRQTHALILVVIMLLASGLACTLSDTTQANSEPLRQPTVFVQPTSTITPLPQIDDQDEEDDNSSNNGSNSGNSGNNSGNSGNSGGVIVGCNPRTDWYIYRVVSGDTLGIIAQRTNTSINVLSTANCLANANSIRVGQTLYVPQNPYPPTITPAPQAGRSSYVSVTPYIFSDAGFYFLQAGATVTVSYPEAPAASAIVRFFLNNGNGTVSQIGEDSNVSNGITVSWVVPSVTSGSIEAVVLRSDLSIIQRSFLTGVSTGYPLPTDKCVVQAETIAEVTLWSQPTTAGQTRWGSLSSVGFMEVVGVTRDGWRAVDPPQYDGTAFGIYWLKWIEPNAVVGMHGPCDNLPTLTINVSSTGCFVNGAPDAAVPYYDMPDHSSTTAGSLNASSSFEVLGQTSDGWYGIDTGSTNGYGAYRLKWLRSDANISLGPNCGSLPTIN